MKRLLLTLTVLMGFMGIYAQEILLMPSTEGQIMDAHHPINVLLKYNAHFTYMESVEFEYEIRGLSFEYKTMTLTLCETRDPTPEEAKIFSSQEYPWHDKYEMKISKEQADALFSLFTSAVYTSSHIDSDKIKPIEGCTYRFSAYPYSGSTISPASTSNCGRLVSIARKVCQSVKSQDSAKLDALMNDITALTDVFISYYPFEFNKRSLIYSKHKRNKVKGPSVGLKY